MKRQFFINILLIVTLLIGLAMLPDCFLVRRSYAADLSSSGYGQWKYTMKAGIRFIPFFWINKSNVGGGEVSFSEDADGTKELALLIGSDPERAPRKINRWGYIVERVSGSTAELTGIMSQSDEESIDDAKESTEKPSKRYVFKGIRSHLDGAEAQSDTFRIKVTENYTYKDVDTLLGLMPATGESTRKLQVPAGTDSGFLFAVKAMLYEPADNFKRSGELTVSKSRNYVYNALLYDLSVSSLKMKKHLKINGREYKQLIESKFEARNSETGKVNRYVITYGTEAPFFKVPVKIVYQPRWWFRAELFLDEVVNTSPALPEVLE